MLPKVVSAARTICKSSRASVVPRPCDSKRMTGGGGERSGAGNKKDQTVALATLTAPVILYGERHDVSHRTAD